MWKHNKSVPLKCELVPMLFNGKFVVRVVFVRGGLELVIPLLGIVGVAGVLDEDGVNSQRRTVNSCSERRWPPKKTKRMKSRVVNNAAKRRGASGSKRRRAASPLRPSPLPRQPHTALTRTRL